MPNIFTNVVLKDGNGQPLGTEIEQQSTVKLEMTFIIPETSTPFPAGASFTTTLPKNQINFAQDGSGVFDGDVAEYSFDHTTAQLTIKLLKAVSFGSWKVNITTNFKQLTANDSLDQTLVFHTKDHDTKIPISFKSNAEPVEVADPKATPQSFNPTGIEGSAKFNLNGAETSKTDPTKWDSDPAKRSKNADMELTLTAQGSGETYPKSLTFSDSDLAKIKVSSAPVNVLGDFTEATKSLVAGRDYHAVLSDDKRTVKIYLTGGFKKSTGYQVDYTASIDRSLDDTGKMGSALVEGYRFLTGSQTNNGYGYKSATMRNSGVAITKSGDITNNFRAMNWQIDWDFSMDTMKAGATLTDRFGKQVNGTDDHGQPKIEKDDNQSLDTQSLKVFQVTFDQNANPTVSKDDIAKYFKLTDKGNGEFTLTYLGGGDLPDNASFRIQYQTKLKNTPENGSDISNIVNDQRNHYTHATYPVRLPSAIQKVSGKIDAYLGQMTWRINANRTFRNMRDGKIFDLFPDGVDKLDTDPTAANINTISGEYVTKDDDDGANDGILVYAQDPDGNRTLLKPETDYTMSTNDGDVQTAVKQYNDKDKIGQIDANGQEKGIRGFVVTLKGKYAETDSQIVIYTHTKLDMLKLGQVGHDNDALAKALNNRAFFFFDLPPGDDEVASGGGSSTPTPQKGSFSGALKNSWSDAPDTQYWGVLVNQLGLKYGHLHLTDILPRFDGVNYELIPDSIKFYEVTGPDGVDPSNTGDPTTSGDVKEIKTNPYYGTSGWVSTALTADDAKQQSLLPTNPPDTWLKNNKDLTQQLDFDFPNIDTGRVWVVFKTKRANQWNYNDPNFTNQATVTDTKTTTTIPTFNPSASKSAQSYWTPINKTVSEDAKQKNVLNWHVQLENIQDKYRPMVNPIITDTLEPYGSGAEINATSFKVTLQVGSADEVTLDKGKDYDLALDGNNFTVTFHRTFGNLTQTDGNPLNNYRVNVYYATSSKNSGTVGNTSAVAWDGSQTTKKPSDGVPENARIATTNGFLPSWDSGISGETITQLANLVVEKKDSVSGAPIPGVKFRVSDGTHTFEATTKLDANSQNSTATFQGLPLGDYTLTELNTPAGYKPMAPQKIRLNTTSDSGTAIQTQEVENQPYQIILTKYDNRAEGQSEANRKQYQLANATYDLIDTDTQKKLLTDLKTNDDGQITVGTATSFSGNYTNDDFKPDLKAGQYVLEGLKPGHYKLIEREAPEHYRGDAHDQANVTSGPDKQLWIDSLNAGSVTTAISDETPTATVAAYDQKKPGQLDLKKQAETIKDDHFPDRQPMTGAAFKLYRYGDDGKLDYDKSWQATVTNSDGTVSFNANDLYEGKYQLIETKAPAGYVIPTDLAKGVDVEITGDQTLKFPTIEEPVFRRAVTLNKTDGDFGNPIAGITYALYRENGTELAKDLVTNEKGQVNLPFNLPAGSYYFKETKTLPPYRPNTDKHSFTVKQTDQTQTAAALATENKQKPITVDVTNYQVKTINVKKVDSQYKDHMLAGATFRLTNSAGYSRDITTGKDGLASFGDLLLGHYSLTEVKAPAGYKLDTTVYPITLASGETPSAITVTKEIADDPYQVALTKYDNRADKSDDAATLKKYLLPGATYKLVDTVKNKTLKAGMKTNSDGQLKFGAASSFDTPLKAGEYAVEGLQSDRAYRLVETEAPKHYRGDASDQANLTTGAERQRWEASLRAGSVNFTIKTDQTQLKVTATNQKKPGQLAIKKQAETIKDDKFPDRQPMTGAEFKLYRYDEDGTLDRDKTWTTTITNNDGTVTFNDADLYEGKYQLVETKAPTGYVIPDDLAKGIDVTITGDQTLTLPTIEEPVFRRSIALNKTDGNFGNPIAGITYALYREDGTELAKDLVTNEKGQVNLPFNLPAGSYYFKETKTLPPYRPNTDKHPFTIKQTDLTQTAADLATQNKQKPITVGVTNYQIKTLNVQKVDRTYSDHVLAGAVFRLTNSTGYSRDVTTDEKGIASFGDLLLGNYSLTEIKAPSGYRLDPTVHAITLSSAITPTPITVNKQIADDPYQVTLTKYDNRVKKTDDAATLKKYLLPNATYKLVDTVTNKTLKADLKTNDDGQLKFGAASSFDTPLKAGEYTIDGLKPDRAYRLVETEAPKHYEGDATDQKEHTSGAQKDAWEKSLAAGSVDFTIKADETQVKLTATNQKKPGQLAIKKQAETIKDDKFPDRQPMTGAEFKLYRYQEDGKLDQSRSWHTVITNNDGTVTFKDLDLYEGKYQLVETKAPTGYVIPDDLAKGVDVEITGDQTLKFPTIEESVFRRSIALNKTDGNFGNPIAGITYALYREDGTELAKDLVTDEKGQVNLPFNLPAGSYYFKETKTLRPYRPNTDKHPFTVKQTDLTQTANALAAENKQKPIAVSVTNYQIKTLNVQKVDRQYTDHTLAGAIFRLTNSTGYSRDITTDEKGIASFGDLLLGSYSLTEVKAPSGYRLDPTVHAITLSSAITPTPITVNKQIVDDPYQVTLTKYDNRVKKTDNAATLKKYLLPGATYKLVDTVTNKTLKADMKTNDDGQLKFGAASSFDTPLKAGEYTVEGLKADNTYRLVETEAPKHYEGDATDQTKHTSGAQKDAWEKSLAAGNVDFTIKGSQTQVKLTATNQKKPGQLAIKKQAETIKDDKFPDRQPMTGAEFKLYRYDEDGTLDRDKTWTTTITNNDGTVTFNDADLYEGKYQLVETKAPTGYVIPDDLAKGIDVTITGDQTLTLPTITEPLYRRTAQLAKTDGDFGNPIAGITYALYKDDGTELAKDLVTNKDGQVTLPFDLPAGQYYFQETGTLPPYRPNTDKHPFTVKQTDLTQTAADLAAQNKQKPITVGVTNYQIKTLNVQKVDRQYTNHTLAGATFRLTNSTGYSRDVTTDEKGIASFGDLLLGNYSLTEIKAPSGYRLDPTVHAITLSSAITPTPITVNKQIADDPYQVTLTKYDNRVKKTDDAATLKKYLLPNATYKLVDTVTNKTLKADMKTNDDGQLKFGTASSFETPLKAGEYTIEDLKSDRAYRLVETEAPKHYEGDATDQKEHTSGARKEAWEKSLAAGNVDFTIKADEAQVKLTATNQEKAGQVVITKKADTTGDQRFPGKMTMIGAKFTLYRYREDGTVDHSKSWHATITNQNGIVTLSDHDLYEGKYQLLETQAPRGYVIPDNLAKGIDVNVKGDQKISLDPIIEPEFTRSVQLQKTDGNFDKQLGGVTFNLYGSDDRVLAKDLVTDRNGQIKLPFNLPIGTYYFEETKTLPKYELNTDKITFKVEQTDLTQTAAALAKLNQQQPIKVQVANYQVNTLVVKKVDAANTDHALAGAVFRLTNDQGYRQEITTDANGLASFNHLKLGRYWLTEIKAPAGYSINPDYAQPVAVEVKAGDTMQLVIADKRHTLPSTDGTGGAGTGSGSEAGSEAAGSGSHGNNVRHEQPSRRLLFGSFGDRDTVTLVLLGILILTIAGSTVILRRRKRL
ncbi:SpaA isopeptide-forming pilin-related protein [Lacticaseibacillus rhamnosus]|uniref:SpaA isopeptide-forming pilin-related protein n=1 Tax=Lacticaseibacillus rhamnosus TaxID=47715 RepID=UPI00287B75A9|nr:SpaA isopeptide-forming pilin-related protein [Lacticaseibacillus rhamnosus]